MRDSIFYSAMRALFSGFSLIVGMILGIFLLILIISTLVSSSSESSISTVNSEVIMPNAEGERKSQTSEAPVILELDINNTIGTQELTLKSVKQQLMESREGNLKNNRVKAIFLHVNTPGGAAYDSDGIYQALLAYKKKYKTPIYAFVDGLCASGGMYVVSAADKIYATSGSIIGSVGVITSPFPNFNKLMEKLGIETLTLSAGKDKDALNPFRPWKSDEDANYKQIIEFYYDDFVKIVSSARPKLTEDKLRNVYGAQIFPAPLAKEYGYVDFVGATREEVLKDLLKEIGIEGDFYQVIKLENKEWWSELFSSPSALFRGTMTHKIELPGQLDASLQNQYLYLYQP